MDAGVNRAQSSMTEQTRSQLLYGALNAGIVASILLTVYLRTLDAAASAGWVLVCTRATVPEPDFPRVLTTFVVEPLPVYLLLASAAAYIWAFRRVNRRRRGRHFSRWHAASFLSGIALVLLTVFGPLAAWDSTFLTVHMVQHFILITIAPPLLLAGAPLTIALIVMGRENRNRWIYPILESEAFHYFSHPMVGVALFALIPISWSLTPAFEAALDNDLLHYFGYALFLFGGIHYWWPIVSLNPTRWNLPYPVRALYILALVPIHAFLGVLFYEPSQLLYPEMAETARTWGPSPLSDQQFSGMFMMVFGEAIGIISLIWVLFQWATAEEREAQRIDARRDRERARAEQGVPQ
jgi:putative copper resistance protein D